MSTYQGARFVVEQIRSILDQLPDDGRLIIRDDGSTDQTVRCIQSVADPRIQLFLGDNCGFARSFLWLIERAGDEFDLLLLSDQDDVWQPDRIARTWAALGQLADTPALFCSGLQLVDAQLQPIGRAATWPRPPSFENALVENIVTGCTAALNRAARRLVIETGAPGEIYFHDWWLYLVVSAFGQVVYDPEPVVLYRQHENNVVGRGTGWRRYLRSLRFVRRRSWVGIMLAQVLNFWRVHGARLPAGHQAALRRAFNPERGLPAPALLFGLRRRRQWFEDELALRAMLALEWLSGRLKRGPTP